MKKNSILLSFFVLFLIGLFLIFFVGKKDGGYHLTPNGLSSFKKGLDVAGGVKLTYKIDFSKYRQIYTNEYEFNEVKSRVENIILENISSRVSKLGVSDYSTYIQTLNSKDYVVVELGGIKDVEKAKSTIGKTVELEFKVPFEKSKHQDVVESRKEMALNLLKQTIQEPSIIEELGTGKQSENIQYNNYKEVNLQELPSIYKENINSLSRLSTGEVYPSLLSGVYGQDYVVQQGSLTPQTKEGWTVVKFNGMKKEISDSTSLAKLQEVARKNKLNLNNNYTFQEPKIENNNFEVDNGKIIYNAGEAFSGEKAYNLDLYKISIPSFLGKSESEISNIKSSKEELSNNVKQALQNGSSAGFSGVSKVSKGWETESNISSNASNLNLSNLTGGVNVVKKTNDYYVYNFKNSKDYSEKLYSLYTLDGVQNSEDIVDDLRTKYIYNFEDIFIEKSPQWVTAKDPKSGKILNGAYFKYANIDQSQGGQPVVVINFDSQGKTIFCNLTEVHQGKQMAIFVGGELKTAPNINEKICGGAAQISGQFTSQEAKELTDNLNEGAFPARLILSNEEKVSPSLGEEALKGAIYAGIIGFLAIIVFMIFFFNINYGIVALFSLGLFLTLLFGLIKLTGYSLSLSGIAAVVLSIGMAVDANILIFERIREEVKSGKGFITAIKDGYSRSLSAIRDGNLTTFMIALLLFVIGMNIFKGFGTMMIVNILITLFVVVPVTLNGLLYIYDKEE